MAQLADNVMTSLADKKISAYESMQIGLSGTSLATTIMGLITEAPEDVRKELVVVLKRARANGAGCRGPASERVRGVRRGQRPPA